MSMIGNTGFNYPFCHAQVSLHVVLKVGDKSRICKPFREPRNRYPAWRASTTTMFDVPARQVTKADGMNSLESIPGLLKRLQIQAQETPRRRLKVTSSLNEIATELEDRVVGEEGRRYSAHPPPLSTAGFWTVI
jgi:hypothetical protein